MSNSEKLRPSAGRRKIGTLCSEGSLHHEDVRFTRGASSMKAALDRSKTDIMQKMQDQITDALIQSGEPWLTVHYFWNVSKNHAKRTFDVRLTAEICHYEPQAGSSPDYYQQNLNMLKELTSDT